MDILAIIPARSGSKGVKNKNMRLLCGRPLMQYSIEAASKSTYITRISLSTDDESYADFGRELGIDVIIRPGQLALDGTPMKDVIDWHLNEYRKRGYEPDAFVLLQPTSPLRTEKHIDDAIQLMIEDETSDAVVSVVEVPHNFLPMKLMKEQDGKLSFFYNEGEKYTTRQEMEKLYARNGAAIYATYTDTYYKTHSLYGTRCAAYIMNRRDSVDIDCEEDFELAEFYFSRRKMENDKD